MENETIALKKIISILINQLMIMKNENDMLRNQLIINKLKDAMGKIAVKTNSEIYANAKSGDMVNTGVYANAKNEDIVKSKIYANAENEDRIISEILSKSKFVDPINLIADEELETEAILNSIFSGQPEILHSIQSVLFPKPENETDGKKAKEPAQLIVPAYIEITSYNALDLTTNLRGYIHPFAKEKKWENVGKELLLMHNKGTVTSKELRAVTGLTKDGFAKHLPTLHRSGLVIRHTYNKYSLAEVVKKEIAEIFGVEAKPKN